MTNLIGYYELKIDTKGRFIFPSTLKKQMGEEISNGFVMKKSIFQQCVELYPAAEWVNETKKISHLNRFVKKHNDFIRLFMSGAKQVLLDEVGRLLIPKELIVFSGITKDLVLVSSIDRLEIWDKDKYNTVINNGAADFESLAEDVMGQLGDDMEV